ncbi:MAG: hypothetical protein II438_03525, partial [Clostridiales bacterium]|nr:hypothetical protein [Clostridiales bacterium]
MITDSFDDKSEAIVTPGSFFGERKHICDTAIVTFSREIFEEALAKYPNEQVSELGSVNKIRPIHLLDIGGMKAVLYISEMGSAQAATDFIEVNWKTGADKFILETKEGSSESKVIAVIGDEEVPLTDAPDEIKKALENENTSYA